MANYLTRAYTKLKASSGYRLAQTTVQLPLGLEADSGSFAGIGVNMVANQQVTAGDVYQTIVTGLQ